MHSPKLTAGQSKYHKSIQWSTHQPRCHLPHCIKEYGKGQRGRRTRRRRGCKRRHLLPEPEPIGEHRQVFSGRRVAQHKGQEEDAWLLISDAQLVCRAGPLSPQGILYYLVAPIHELAMHHLEARQTRQDFTGGLSMLYEDLILIQGRVR